MGRLRWTARRRRRCWLIRRITKTRPREFGMGGAGFASIVVVNYNGRHFLAECLTALERQTVPRHRYEVLLIDNGSLDGSVTFVREHFPGVRVYGLQKNLGFTGAN